MTSEKKKQLYDLAQDLIYIFEQSGMDVTSDYIKKAFPLWPDLEEGVMYKIIRKRDNYPTYGIYRGSGYISEVRDLSYNAKIENFEVVSKLKETKIY